MTWIFRLTPKEKVSRPGERLGVICTDVFPAEMEGDNLNKKIEPRMTRIFRLTPKEKVSRKGERLGVICRDVFPAEMKTSDKISKMIKSFWNSSVKSVSSVAEKNA